VGSNPSQATASSLVQVVHCFAISMLNFNLNSLQILTSMAFKLLNSDFEG
jgi:hypothetical protein